VAGRGQAPAVGAEGQGLDLAAVPLELVGLLASAQVPDVGRPRPARGEAAAVGAERQLPGARPVEVELVEELAAGLEDKHPPEPVALPGRRYTVLEHAERDLLPVGGDGD